MMQILDSEYENELLHNAESFILKKLLDKQYSGGSGDSSINIEELMDSIPTTMSPLLDQAIEDLVAQSLIHSEDGENYIITPEGIGEIELRKREAIPL